MNCVILLLVWSAHHLFICSTDCILYGDSWNKFIILSTKAGVILSMYFEKMFEAIWMD